jgi:hypothetical protein
MHVAGCAVDVAVEIELQRDGGGAEPACRGHLREAGDRRKLLLEGDEAIVSGLAPGNVAETVMVGKSTIGSAATGNKR